MTAERQRGLDVSEAVADIQRPGEIDSMVVAAGFPEEQCAGLSAFAGILGPMRTVIPCVDVRTALRELIVERCRHSLVILFGENPARDARLIGDDDYENERRVDPRDGFCRSFDELDLARMRKVMSILDDGPVAIEEDRSWKLIQLSARLTAADRSPSNCSGTLRKSR